MNEIQIFENEGLNLKVRAILQDNGDILISAEDSAKGFGFIKTEIKNGKEYVSIRWKRINDYLEEFNFRPQVGEGDFIPESIFYLLGMKAKNEIAKKFQLWLATDVIPSIRKTGSYTKNWVLGCMNATKWEDLSVEDNNRIIELIFTTAKLLTIKKFEQLSMEV